MIWAFFHLFICMNVGVLACGMSMCVHAGTWMYRCVWSPGINLRCHSSGSIQLVFWIRASHGAMLTGLGAPGMLLSLSSQHWESNIVNRINEIIICLRQGLAVFKSGFGLTVFLPPTPVCHHYGCVPPCLVTDSILINLIGIVLNTGIKAWSLCGGWRYNSCPRDSKASIILTGSLPQLYAQAL